MRVSILIPCYNAEGWVAQAIESALAQTWGDKEVIVVDDGSTDGSVEVIRGFEGRIRWESGPNRGGGSARNRLLALATGEWLQYLDADDFLLPEKISRQAAFVAAHPEVDVLCSPTQWEKILEGEIVSVETRFPEDRDPWAMLAGWHLPQTGGPLWRRAALESVGGWKVGQPCCQEHELYQRLLEAGRNFAFNDECLAVYRVWDLGDRLVPRHIDEIPRQRMIILDRMEAFLTGKGGLNASRRQAINDARHQMARSRWLVDRDSSMKIVQRITQSDPRFRPSDGPASPRAYRMTYKLLGFRGAQWVAGLRRQLGAPTFGPVA